MDVPILLSQLNKLNVDFYTGVPDSQLKPLCNYLVENFGISNQHIIAANEGNAVALAAGYHLSTGKIPCVYLQNSGLGNIVNPVTSLLNDQVYSIPCVFVMGWRGEPGVHDEPQHVYQGEITLNMLETLDIAYFVIDNETTENELRCKIGLFKQLLDAGKSVAFVVKKGGLAYNENVTFKNNYTTSREQIIQRITEASKGDIMVSTTGKTSRELFEIREQSGQSHKYDFLTVGSMGHSSSIALGIALNKPNTKVWCIDGDGAALMHMGAMAVIGSKSLPNFIHVIINNCAHESVGGQPTIADSLNFQQIASGCGYKYTYQAHNLDELKTIFKDIEGKQGTIFIEVKTAIGSRENLGRPTNSPIKNKEVFMDYVMRCD